MAILHNLGSIDKILRYASPCHKSGLVHDQLTNLRLEPPRQGFADGLHRTVLQRHRPVRARGENPIGLGEESDVRSVDAAKVGDAIVEILEEAPQSRGNLMTGRTVEGGTQTIWPRSTVLVHPPDRRFDFFVVERSDQGLAVDARRADVERVEVESPRGGPRTAQQLGVEDTEGFSFAMVVDHLDAVDQESPDAVPPKPLRGSSMEEFCVLIPLLDRAEFPALLPVGGVFLDRKRQRLPRSGPQRPLRP